MICRHCRSAVQLPFLDLGSAPPSNAYLSRADLFAPERWYPLRLLVCTECWLVQTDDHAERDALFTQDYAYFSSFSSSWLEHARNFTAMITADLGLTADSMVAEIAANDGYLLQYMQAAGIPCYGVEPTASTAQAARNKGITIIERFFGCDLADQLVAERRDADLLIANNVLAHVPDINDFVAGFARLLKPDGVASFEFPHLLQMVQEGQFDTAYHEHYSYLSLTAVARVFSANGLEVFDVSELPTHGGSLRVFAQRQNTGTRMPCPAVAAMLSREASVGMTTPEFYTAFQPRAEAIKNGLVRFLLDAKRDGLRVGAYGAAAKGNTLLNFSGLRPDLLPYIVDLNPAKQGRFMPGSRIPIVEEPHLVADRPDVILILPWNLRAEITEQLAYARQWGARFATAVPQLCIQ